MATVSPLYFNTTTGFNQQINTTSDLVALFNLQLTALSTGVAKVDATGNFSSSLVVNADVDAAAAIDGTKISPNFGAQAVSTTGTLSAGASTLDSAVVTNAFSAGASTLASAVVSGALSAGASTLASAVVSGTLSAGASTLDSAVVTNAFSAGASTLASAVVSGALSAGASTLASAVVSGALSAGASTFASVAVSNLTAVPGLVHNDSLGNLMTSALVNADVSASAAIEGTKISPDFGAQNVATTGNITSGSAAAGSPFADITNSSFKLSDAASVQQFLASSDGSILVGTGLGQISINAASSGKIGNLTDPTLAQDAATKAYVDAVAQGISPKNASVFGYSTNQSLSGLPAGLIEADQVLLTGQTNAIDNGLWLVHAGAWTRPANFANGQNAAGAYTFVQLSAGVSGSLPGATGWICTTPEAAAIIGTNVLTFSQFSAAGEYIPGSGISFAGTTINVDITSNATASGLQFQGTQLSLLPDTTRGLNVDLIGAYIMVDAASGISINSSAGVQAHIDTSKALAFNSSGGGGTADGAIGVTLQSSSLPGGGTYSNVSFGASGGLDVAGVPSLFMVGGSAVGATVTAANLDTLTNGSNADALHYHDATYIALPTSGLTNGTVVALSAGSLVAADRATNGRISGIVVAPGQIAASGIVSGLTLTSGSDYYLGNSGALVAGVPSGAGYTVFVGTAISSTQLLIGSIPPGTYLN